MARVSAHQQVSIHLADYARFADQLLNALATMSAPRRSHNEVDLVMNGLIRKDELLQESVNKLIDQVNFQLKLKAMKEEIKALDSQIIGFAEHLGQLEQTMHDAVTDERTLKNIDGHITKQSFSVHDVTVLAERLGQRSFAPVIYQEKTGMSERIRPPNPIEREMGHSLLHLSLDELLKVAEINKKIDRDVGNALQAAGEAGGLLEDKNVSQSAELPSFSQMTPREETKMDVWDHTPALGLGRKGKVPLLSLELNPDAPDDSDAEEGDDDDSGDD